MRFEPISEEKAAETSNSSPFPRGDYDFEVTAAAEGVSSAGNEQFAVELFIYNQEGKRRKIFDYLGIAANMQWKFRQFCEAIGMIDKYEAGEINDYEMIDRVGRASIGIQNATAEYPARNRVMKYLPREAEVKAAPRPTAAAAAATATKPRMTTGAAAATRKQGQTMVPAGVGSDLSDEIPF